MGDSYREILIKKETTSADRLKKTGLIVLIAALLAGGILITPILLLAGVAAAVAAGIWLFPRLDVEYEYLYVNGELDVDVIYSRQKRKKAGSYDMRELEILAPAQSHALDSYMQSGSGKLRDYTSGSQDAQAYILVLNQEKGRAIIKVELDDEIIADIRRMAPRKVNLY
jgi:hypothetical protein